MSVCPVATEYHEGLTSSTSLHRTSIGLVIYDYLLTLPAEVELFWRWELSGASALFLATRYFVLGYIGIDSYTPAVSALKYRC